MSAHLVDLLTSNSDLLDKLDGAVEHWRSAHGRTASRSACDLAKVISASVLGLRAQSERAREDLASGLPDPDAVLSLNNRAFFVRDLIRILDLSSHASLHPVLTPAIQAQLGQLKLRGQVLVSGLLSSYAQEEYSYELLPLTRDAFAPFADSAALDQVSAWPLLVFRIPSPPAEWPLFHALIFHEIGHALFRSHKSHPFPTVPPELDHALAASGSDLVKQAEAFERRRLFAVTAVKWTEELFADAVGVLLTGPAFFSAFTRMLTAFPSDTASETHPPTIFRIRLLASALRARSLIDPLPGAARQVIEAWEEESKRITAYPAASNKQLFRTLPALLARQCEAVYPDLLAHTARILGDLVLTPDDLRLDLERGNRLLNLRIPPVEMDLTPKLDGTPAALSPPRVFSSCWAAYYFGIDAKKSPREVLSRCSHALLDSLDGSEAIRVWAKAAK